jgi:hypothetical protein
MRELLAIVSIAAALALAAGALIIATGYMRNNTKTDIPSQSEFLRSRDRAVDWIREHETEVLAIENPALWRMLRESAALSHDTYLTGLYSRYYDRYLAYNPGNVWHHLFDDDSRLPISVADVEDWPDYNLLFLYGLSCQPGLRADPRVKRLMDGRACGAVGSPDYFLDPACITHQFMGIRFAREHRCEDPERIAQLEETVVNRTALGAAWDFRVVDFYIQRVLMLAESHATSKINPRWIARILTAQRADGGWDDFDQLLPLGGGKSIGWSGRGIRLWTPESNFHTTAQGLYLMALLSVGAIN